VMWTTAGIVSFATYGLVRLATDPRQAWKVRILDELIFEKQPKYEYFRLGQ
jgi:hypothetical protein